jgi:hypothetical protein
VAAGTCASPLRPGECPGGNASGIRSGARPSDVSQFGDIPRAEPVAGEYSIGHPVQLPARVGEVTVLQAGVQPLGEPDQLIHAVVLQGGRRIDVIPRLYATRFSELVAGLGVVLAERAMPRGVRWCWGAGNDAVISPNGAEPDRCRSKGMIATYGADCR